MTEEFTPRIEWIPNHLPRRVATSAPEPIATWASHAGKVWIDGEWKDLRELEERTRKKVHPPTEQRIQAAQEWREHRWEQLRLASPDWGLTPKEKKRNRAKRKKAKRRSILRAKAEFRRQMLLGRGRFISYRRRKDWIGAKDDESPGWHNVVRALEECVD